MTFCREGQGEVFRTRWDGTTVVNLALLMKLAGIRFESEDSMSCWRCQFRRDKKTKHEIGVREHRLQPDDGFKGDPFLELWDEAVDADNYLDEIERRGTAVPDNVRQAVLTLAGFATRLRSDTR